MDRIYGLGGVPLSSLPSVSACRAWDPASWLRGSDVMDDDEQRQQSPLTNISRPSLLPA
ncbi:hypothetical protein ACRALDRAFT_2033689 [Sodiomyces alcalophilus JCM 7366]|uniref:uncharacterized protein n=1 Tax=Sodiomyces alcalophilus JCM 7366 TaxID=591952 RepID=UPI0039B57959